MVAGATVISAIDLFCGAGGLSYGLKAAGLQVVGGYDIDPHSKYPFEANIEAPFFKRDVKDVKGAELNRLWGSGVIKVLAGCAPCQPFSSHRRGKDTSDEDEWKLLGEFARLVRTTNPHIVTMENVPRLARTTIFQDFLGVLHSRKYQVSFKSCYGPEYGLPQHRRRLVLLASRIGPIQVPRGPYGPKDFRTVRSAIEQLPPIGHGESYPDDPMHRARALSDTNLERIRASKPGGTWHDWPTELRAPCHQRSSGATFKSVYARMSWDEPAPTITAGAYNFGTGRFGHPSQDRAISLREAAVLQGFPLSYSFADAAAEINLTRMSRLIGNAVPPPLARFVGHAIVKHVAARK
jgi:DNA (cytosine-5)-methyltransferase 1